MREICEISEMSGMRGMSGMSYGMSFWDVKMTSRNGIRNDLPKCGPKSDLEVNFWSFFVVQVCSIDFGRHFGAQGGPLVAMWAPLAVIWAPFGIKMGRKGDQGALRRGSGGKKST